MDDSESESTGSSAALGESDLNKYIVQRTMREFVGLESGNAEQSTREALLNFSYYLTAGNMDEAFKAIKLIKRSVRV